MFEKLRKFQLKLNLAKCTFEAIFEKLLDFIVNKKRIEIDFDKVRAIQNLTPPCTQKEVRGFFEKCDPIFNSLPPNSHHVCAIQLIVKRDLIFKLFKKHDLEK